jgi:hypothetical protein
MIDELEDVILTCDLPEHGLARGDIGTVVLVHKEGKVMRSSSLRSPEKLLRL